MCTVTQQRSTKLLLFDTDYIPYLLWLVTHGFVIKSFNSNVLTGIMWYRFLSRTISEEMIIIDIENKQKFFMKLEKRTQ